MKWFSKTFAAASAFSILGACASYALDDDQALSSLVHDPSEGTTVVFVSGEGEGASEEVGASETENTLINFGGVTEQLAVPRFASYEMREGSRNSDQEFIPYSVIHPDERVVAIDTTLFPESATVQIKFQNESGDTYGCSGALVASDFVLTAGHCVYDDEEWSKNMVVWPGRNGPAEPFGSCRVEKMFTLDQWVSSSSSMAKRNYDIAGIRLDCSIGSDTGLFDLAASIGPGDVSIVRGYPCDRVPNKQYRSDSEVTSATSQKVFYQNDTYGCMSGGPVTDASGALVAIHTNGLHNGEPWASNNAATRISENVLTEINQWMAE